MTTKQLSNKFTISKIFMLTLLLFTFTFAKTPQWIIKPPVNAAYYNGVGSAPMIEGNSDHIETARQAALSSIASQININIQSDVVSSIMENNDEIKENFERNIRTSTQASLEGYEIKDQYTSNGTFYTWIRLSKAKYQEIQAEKRKKAAELSLSFYREYENALENNNVATALNNAVRAIQSADAYIPDGLEYTLDGEEIYLVNHYYQSIQNLLDGIEIKPVQKVVKTKTGQALKNTAFIVTSNGNTIKNLPLLLSINGEGNDIPKSIRSDFSGKAVVRGAILHDSKKIQTLKASMELKGDKDSGAFLFPALLSQIQIPTGSIMLQVSGPVIYLTSDEQMNGTPV
ncbi:MAG: LPP20 family lipoprotein, partial [Candidatus Marinimicrobia bacterium]|nr:LPP20 family lipoprotein [Candidatus Neomarinimicrobiota bacterium]